MILVSIITLADSWLSEARMTVGTFGSIIPGKLDLSG